MDYITVVASTYEEAVAQARKQYGDKLRIHSRKDVKKAGFLGMGKSTECELTCFLTEDENESAEKNEVDLATHEETPEVEERANDEELKRFEKEAITPNPDANVASLSYFEQAKKNVMAEFEKEKSITASAEEPAEEEKKPEPDPEPAPEPEKSNESVDKLLKRVQHILDVNDFTKRYSEWLVSSIKEILQAALPQIPTDDELEIMVLDKIAESLLLDNSFSLNPERVVIVLGPASAGKTTMVAKLVAAFSSINSSVRRNVRVVLLDDSPATVAQLQKLGKALNIGVSVAPHEAEMEEALNAQFNNELVFVDSLGKTIQNSNPDYRIYGLMNVVNKNESKFLLTIPASMKNSDIVRVFEQYKSYPLSGLLVTKLDETATVGNVISLCHEHNLPILYTSAGKKIPKDISKATSGAILRLLQGFTVDINEVLDSEQ